MTHHSEKAKEILDRFGDRCFIIGGYDQEAVEYIALALAEERKAAIAEAAKVAEEPGGCCSCRGDARYTAGRIRALPGAK